ncbi:MAG: SulP family inorganic anion transporter [Clostridia bacterium]|nr:SulP family inorganic anion transporter [Clostridia bacterium]
MNIFSPMLFTDLKKYSKEQFIKDIIAGIIVAVIALPLSIALAIASGVTPEAGIYTAIIAGFIAALLGGSSVQITGPTAAFATIVAGIVARNGMGGLALATVIAGIFLIIMGLFKLGDLIRFIPFTITTGFTAGIAVTLLIGQLKDFCGVTYQNGEAPIETIEKLETFIANASTINLQAIFVGLVCLLILGLWPKINDKIPASLLAVAVSIAMVQLLGLKVNTIGSLYELSNSLPSFKLPAFTIHSLSSIIPDALTIAILAAIESLLSCVVADGMISKHHRSNTELIAQGAANIGSALFGGIPATGAIARTAANIKSGGRTPVTGIVHSIVLLLVLVVLMPYAAYIPMSAIAAILINVAYNMCQWRSFVHLVKSSPKSDIIVLVLTFVLTVVIDLVIAIEVGIVAACVLFLKRMSEESRIESWKYDKSEDHMDVPLHISVYELNGPMFFAVARQLQMIKTKNFTKCVILRMRSVPSIDTDALRHMDSFVKRCKDKGITVIFSHVNEQPMRAIKKAGLYQYFGEENFCANIDEAMERASKLNGE